MAKFVELRRHTDNDGDALSDGGIKAALEIGRGLDETYEVFVSSGTQRATQTAACFLAVMAAPVSRGVIVDARWRSDLEERWKEAYQAGGGGDLESFRSADPDLVAKQSARFGQALADLFELLPSGGRALVVGHSPMQEAAVLGLTDEVVEPLSKGAGIVVEQQDDRGYEIRLA
jgi:broad specificity phosphatase PhoE